MSTSLEMTEWEERKLPGVFLADEREREHVAFLRSSRIIDITELVNGIEIKSNSHVGQISFKNLHLSVKPKLTGLALVRLFCYTYGFENLKLIGSAYYKLGGMEFFDLLIYALVSCVDNLVRSNIPKGYTRRNESLPCVRGRIDTNRIALNAGVLSANMPCRFFHREENTFLNRITLSGLRLAHSVAVNSDLRYELLRTIKALSDSIESVDLNRAALFAARQSIDRLTENYHPIIDIIEILFNAKSQEMNVTGMEMALPGYFFDMNRFFEVLILKLLNTLPGEYKVIDQYRLKQLFGYDFMYNPRGRMSPTPRPDFALMKNGRVLKLLDAKYCDLWNKELPANILYQLSVYALSGIGKNTAAILYPAVSDEPEMQIINIFNPIGGSAIAHVEMRAINLRKISNFLEAGNLCAIEKYIADSVLPPAGGNFR